MVPWSHPSFKDFFSHVFSFLARMHMGCKWGTQDTHCLYSTHAFGHSSNPHLFRLWLKMPLFAPTRVKRAVYTARRHGACVARAAGLEPPRPQEALPSARTLTSGCFR